MDLEYDFASLMPDLRGKLRFQAALAAYSWFRVGGAAEIMFTPADMHDLAYFLARLPAEIPVHVLGLCSNTLIRDGGIPGVVVRLGRGFGGIERDGSQLHIGAAVPDMKVAEAAANHALSGLSFYRGIPGSIGGALRMNAGAYGRETVDVFCSARAVTRDGEILTLGPDDMGFSYRHSRAPADLVFVSAVLQGQPADPEQIRSEMRQISASREQTQPIRSRTGGSTFKNPPGQKAWQLIDAAGCRGLRRGGAQVSEQHCNFLINHGAATADDIERLGEEVRARVADTGGIMLEWEIKRVGATSLPG